MPWPLVPPDADFPSPVQRDASHEWFAVRVEMSGMDPHSDQLSTRFSVGGKPASVWVPIERMGKHNYAGVLVSRFTSTQLDARYDDGLHKRNRAYPIPVKTVSQSKYDLNVAVTRQGNRLEFEVVGKGGGSGAHVVVSPFFEAMPKMESFAEYQAAGAWAPLLSGKARIKLTGRPDIKTYAVFIALGVPSKIFPVSAVEIVDL